MALFEGLACFSPEVSRRVQDTWITHGGMITKSLKQGTSVKYIFCNGRSDSWVANLVRKAIPVFDAKWVIDSATQNFCIPLATYLLNNSRLDRGTSATKASAPRTPVRQVKHHPEGSAINRPVKRPYEPQDEPESAERPRKKARILESRITLSKRGVSTTSLVEATEDVIPIKAHLKPRQKQVPCIDLVQVKRTSSQSSLNVKFIEKEKASADLLPAPVLKFKQGGDKVLHTSSSEVLQTLQDARADKCVLFTPGAFHSGRQFLCHLPTSTI